MHKTTMFLGIIIVLAMIAIGLYIWQNEQDKKALQEQLQEATIQPIETTTDPEDLSINEPTTTTPATNSGTITGSVSFPSEVIPNMEVCADNINSADEICTTDILEDSQYTYGMGYRLDVPPGEYQVYAKLPTDPYKAYYNEFVECGLQASCPSHTPITVSVNSGDVITGVDPQDWYNQ